MHVCLMPALLFVGVAGYLLLLERQAHLHHGRLKRCEGGMCKRHRRDVQIHSRSVLSECHTALYCHCVKYAHVSALWCSNFLCR